MSGRFLITGLPRSRTAWFSVATTTPTSVCHHEPTSRLQSFAELCNLWESKVGADIGISDSSLVPQIVTILDELKPRTLVIERPLDEVLASFKVYAARTAVHMDEAACRRFGSMCEYALHKVSTHPLVKRVQFKDLDDYAVVLDAMHWLLPGREFPNLKTLMGFNIQVSAKSIEASAHIPHSKWHLEGALRC